MKWLFIACMCFSSALWARTLTTEQKLADLSELVGHIKAGYGPLQYKKVKLGLDLEVLKDKYTALIKGSKSNSEFYYLMVKFVAEFNDSHFGATVKSTYQSRLGFTTDLIQGKVLIDQIDRTKLPLDKFPYEKGDEILSMDGRDIQAEVKELSQYMGQGYSLTALRKAAMLVAKRKANKVPVKSGAAELEIRRGDSLVSEKVSLNWYNVGDHMDEVENKVTLRSLKRKTALNYDQLTLPETEEGFRCSGDTRIKIPAEATIIMKSPFVAYYWPSAKGNLGYLRIPHYLPEEADPKIDAYALRFKQYEYAVKVLEQNTVGLVIDQDHNCGGSVDWLHRILGLFIDRPFEPMQFELLANKQSLVEFESWMTEVFENTIEYDNLVTVKDLIKDTWMNTDSYLTKKTSIDGQALVYPNAIRYSKPILMLIDEMSGSGGDAFPSQMQGFGRAKLLGTRTMGAGGHVVELPALNNSQILIRMTKSLFYRPDQIAVENNGAAPDIKYSPSVNDFKYGYLEYRDFYTKALLNML
ncbi:MAG: S41 family peptidase [Bacteriovoracaceae bacterium]